MNTSKRRLTADQQEAPDSGLSSRALLAVRPCVSWRQSGGFWSLHEDGEGERLRLSNSVREIDIDDLRDDDLEILQHLIATAIGFRKIHGPNAKSPSTGATENDHE